jgi:hypothetical protein
MLSSLRGWCRASFAAQSDGHWAMAKATALAGRLKREPTEDQVAAVAMLLANTPLIDSPKLPPPTWMGLARQLLETAALNETAQKLEA